MMLRFRTFVILALLAGGVLSPALALAQEGVVPLRTNTDSSNIPLSIPIGGKTSVSGLPEYLVTVYNYTLGIVTLVAIIMVIYGGFRYLLGATTGDVKSGQTVIKDALGGMAILFLAYVILYNINPKTVNLSLPTIRRITTVDLRNAAAPPPPTTNLCGEPARDAAFRRPPAQTAQRTPGQPCSYDSECASGMCFMQNQTQGICSALGENQRCKCVGQCCGQMTSSNQPNVYLPDTNNGGSGQALCQTGLACNFQNNDWLCTRLSYNQSSGGIRTGSPVRPTTISRPSCRLDSDCASIGAGAACIYNSRLSDSLSGRTECSLGREGDQCRCSGAGCDLVAPPTIRSAGVTMALGNNRGAKSIACQPGLTCIGFVRPAGSMQDPRDLEYFCQRAPADGAVGEGQCEFSCANAPTNRFRSGTCSVADTAAGIRQCGAVCNSHCAGQASTCLFWREATASEPRRYNISCSAAAT